MLAETGEVLAGMFRPGNAGANCAADRVIMLAAAIDQLPAEWRAGHLPGDDPSLPVHKLLVRTDSAGASHWFAEECRARNIGFIASGTRRTDAVLGGHQGHRGSGVDAGERQADHEAGDSFELAGSFQATGGHRAAAKVGDELGDGGHGLVVVTADRDHERATIDRRRRGPHRRRAEVERLDDAGAGGQRADALSHRRLGGCHQPSSPVLHHIGAVHDHPTGQDAVVRPDVCQGSSDVVVMDGEKDDVAEGNCVASGAGPGTRADSGGKRCRPGRRAAPDDQLVPGAGPARAERLGHEPGADDPDPHVMPPGSSGGRP